MEGNARNYLCICYEDLRDDPEGFIVRLSDNFRIRRRRIFSEVTGEKGGIIPYREKPYTPICDGDMAFILTELDIELERTVGYDLTTV